MVKPESLLSQHHVTTHCFGLVFIDASSFSFNIIDSFVYHDDLSGSLIGTG